MIRMMRYLGVLMMWSWISLLSTICSAQILIDSIRTKISNCPNDGNIRVYAKSPNLPVLYSITSGPVTQPIQTGNNFLSLPSGNYAVRISDGIGNSILRNVTIPGNYQPLEFNAVTTDPRCHGESNGKIVGNLNNNTGYGPFTWQLIAPSPVTSSPQVSDTFPNLPYGNYTLRVTDACGSYCTKVVSLNDPTAITIDFYNVPMVEIRGGCDSALVTYFMRTDDFRFPNTYKYETPNGIYTNTTPTNFEIINGSNYFMVQQLIPNFSYGDYLRVTVTNNCGNSATTALKFATQFSFCPYYSNDFKNCVNQTTVHYNINAIGCMSQNNLYTYVAGPIFYSYTDVATNILVDSATIQRAPGIKYYEAISEISIRPTVPTNKTYRLFVRDACGRTFTQNYFIPAPTTYPPTITYKYLDKASCIDSTAMLSVGTQYFKTIPVLVMLSGPTGLHSTKPDYTYTDTYTYPDTFQFSSWSPGNAIYNFYILNMTAGKYIYKIIDSCGSEIIDSITITPDQVTDFSHTIRYKKGCLGENQLYYSFASGYGSVFIQNISNGNIFYKYHYTSNSSTNDSLLNIPSGTYIVELQYHSLGGMNLNNGNFCHRIVDTIVIEGYEIPFVYSSNSLLCQNSLNLEVVPDSSRGVPPYQFEIISGPTVFSLQNSPVFSVNTAGTYTVRIYDVCLNASTRQVTVDTISAPLLTSSYNGVCGKARFTYPFSLYYRYTIRKPDQSVFTGDSLIVDPITSADTGTYFITRITDIGGCKDTSSAAYHVTMNMESKPILSICEGDTIFYGNKFYTLPGVYKDTLVSQSGCDSVVTLTLNVSPIPDIDLGVDSSLCQDQTRTLSVDPGFKAYYWNNDHTDSTRKSITVSTTGKFWVLVKNNAECSATDTLEITNIYPNPVVHVTQDMTICKGESIQLYALGGDFYTWSSGGTNLPSITVAPEATTTYSVRAHTILGCISGQEDITVEVHPSPTTPPFSTSLLKYCFDEEPYRLHPDWGNTFSWLPSGDTAESLLIDQPGTYGVKIFNEYGCSITGEISLIEYCPGKLFVPTAFSPNGDGQNDGLEIFGKHIGEFEMKIFNRWGEIIFISNEKTKQWDGKFRSEDMPEGSYPWTIQYKSEYDQQEQILKGSITILR